MTRRYATSSAAIIAMMSIMVLSSSTTAAAALGEQASQENRRPGLSGQVDMQLSTIAKVAPADDGPNTSAMKDPS